MGLGYCEGDGEGLVLAMKEIITTLANNTIGRSMVFLLVLMRRAFSVRKAYSCVRKFWVGCKKKGAEDSRLKVFWVKNYLGHQQVEMFYVL